MTTNNNTNSIIKTWLPGVSISKEIYSIMGDYRILVYKHVASDQVQEMENLEKQIKQTEGKVTAAFAAYNQLIDEGEYATEEERQMDREGIEGVVKDWEAYRNVITQVLQLSRQGKQKEAMILQAEQSAPLIISASSKLAEIVEFNENGSVNIAKEVASTYDSSRMSLLIVIVLALLIGSSVIFLIGKGIISAIQQLLTVSNEIAKGNLRVSSNIQTKDELGELAASSNQMVGNIRNLITQIQKTAEQVAASSEELTASADQSAQVTQNIAKSITSVSEVTTEQVEAVSDANHQIDTMAVGIEESTATLQHAAEKTKSAVDTAQEGTETIDGAVKQMRSIEDTVTRLAEVVTKLGGRSKEIGKIVVTISGIAGQTNLLALNAAIEAARAGEMGKGFAVVAEEVRKLAEQSQEAAKEIETLITEIQEDTEQAVIAMDKGTDEVKTGANVVQNAGSAFAKIYEMVDEVNHQAEEMVKTMEGLASGTQNIVDSIRKIDDSSKNVAAESQSVSAATEQQSASMEEIAASSRSLAQMAQDLTQMSNRFKI